jgi:hypothetical protein
MSENLDLVGSIYADWGRGDFSSLAWAHPEIEYVNSGVYAQDWHGHGGMVDGFRDWIRVWSDWTVRAERFIEVDSHRVLVLFDSSARMKGSSPQSVRMTQCGATLFHLRDNLVTRIAQYSDRASALADLGLEE